MPDVTSGAAMYRAARVQSNVPLCRDHFRLALSLQESMIAQPGQFVHLAPLGSTDYAYRTFAWSEEGPSTLWEDATVSPLLRRAFSIAGLGHVEGAGATSSRIELMYRVVGAATRWMETLRPGDEASVLGPLGNAFTVDPVRPHAWLVGGGVGLPPMLWFAQSLAAAGKNVIAFCGARSADLLPLDVTGTSTPDRRAASASLCVREFADYGVPAVISSDDGSIGFHGSIVEAIKTFHNSAAVAGADLTVYTCGPEGMMRAVAQWSEAAGVACQVCMERSMACGIGTCQSCVVPVRGDGGSWRYSLCCTEGPVYDAASVRWDDPQRGDGASSSPCAAPTAGFSGGNSRGGCQQQTHRAS